jgi:predicted DNA-binding transcriptional regulator YafY
LLELRHGRITTARRLSRQLEVSERTVYRDVADLIASGVPIEGEAGVGYRLAGFELPPLMFDREEIEALVLGIRTVEAWGDASLADAARAALAKIEAALPRARERLVEETRLYAPIWGEPPGERIPLADLRRAIRARHKVELDYRDEQGRESNRTVRPLALSFYPPRWLLIAWCELRVDFRSFRLDRIDRCRLTADRFNDEPGRGLADYVRRIEEQMAAWRAAQASP